MPITKLPPSQWCVVFVAILLTAVPARACVDTTVRDAAFTEPRDVFRLTVMAGADDPEADKTYRQLKDWLATAGADLNIEAFRVNVDDPQVHWLDYGIPSAPPTYPVVVLGHYRQAEMQSLFVDHWEPAPTQEQLAQLRTSPARETLQRELGRRLAVLLYVPGADTGAGKAKALLDGVCKEWSAKTPLGLSVVQVERSDARERLLLAFTGAGRSDSDWAAVVFGRGKFMPPLQGKDVTAEGLDAQLQVLLEDCTCVRSVSSLGVDIPMVWTKTMAETIVPLRAQTNEATASQPSPSTPPTAGAGKQGNRMLSVTAYTFLALAAAAVAGGAIILLRPCRREP